MTWRYFIRIHRTNVYVQIPKKAFDEILKQDKANLFVRDVLEQRGNTERIHKYIEPLNE